MPTTKQYTTKQYNTDTPIARPRLLRHYLSHFKRRSCSVQNIVKKYVGAAGKTEAISLHFIRHTVDTNIALNEAPLLIFQRLLGHSNSKTTLRYIRHAKEFAARTHRHYTLLI
jgi:site-specific recombinase XerD